jgi:two-component system response regulator DesR
MSLRILVADDHVAVAESFQVLLEKQGWQVRVVHSPEAADALLNCWTADVALLDIEFRGSDRTGFDVARLIAAKWPSTRIIFLSMHTDAVFPEEARKARAAGFLVKNLPSSEIVEAIRRVSSGETWFPPLTNRGASTLTRQTLEVVRHLARGLRHREVATLMNIEETTVRMHVREAKDRTGAKTTAELVRIASNRGWLLLPSPPSPRGGGGNPTGAGKSLIAAEQLYQLLAV